MTRGLRHVALAALAIAAAGCSGTTQSAGQSTVEPVRSEPPPRRTAADMVNPSRPPTPADIHFMTGMIHHHAQAVLMAGWAPSHDASPAVRALCERIVVAQRDEIGLMQYWLELWGQPVPDADPSHQLHGMDHGTLMPGMLTARELQDLDASRGMDFDWLFLTSMIRHHEGALTMVADVIAAGGARDDNVFKFVSDMNADQTTEIERMRKMLAALVTGAPGS